jgi:aryl-alcohol dehydrogenase-like predicted oxidoreductase
MIPKLTFGRTQHQSTRAVFGGASLGSVSQGDADKTLDLLIEHGINHIDTAASYGDAEFRIAPWLKRYPKTFFLGTKTGERTYAKAKEQIHKSLERLEVDHVDLLQLHNLVDPQEWEVAMGPDGALKAAIEAKEQGLVKYIGVTGHGLTIAAMHLKSLQVYDFDSVLLPYSYILNKHTQYARDFEILLKTCQERNVAVQTIKTITRRPWGEQKQTRSTWYEPLEEQADIDKMVHWVIARDGLFFCTVGDIQVLPKVLDAATRFVSKPNDAEMDKVLSKESMTLLFTA